MVGRRCQYGCPPACQYPSTARQVSYQLPNNSLAVRPGACSSFCLLAALCYAVFRGKCLVKTAEALVTVPAGCRGLTAARTPPDSCTGRQATTLRGSAAVARGLAARAYLRKQAGHAAASMGVTAVRCGAQACSALQGGHLCCCIRPDLGGFLGRWLCWLTGHLPCCSSWAAGRVVDVKEALGSWVHAGVDGSDVAWWVTMLCMGCIFNSVL